MFDKKLLKTKKVSEKTFEFDVFKHQQNAEDSPSLIALGQSRENYNLLSEDGSLKSGYGFSLLTMPTNENDLDSEETFYLQGEEICFLWKMKWYDSSTDSNRHYLFFYNNQNNVCFDNIFGARFDAPFVIETEFSSLPFITNYRSDSEDTILLSGKDDSLLQIFAGAEVKKGTAPAIISCCNHYGKMFAITASARGRLVYSTDDIFDWTDQGVKNLDFSDERGDLNKIISFNDYVYLFRDFGITKLSIYGDEEEFAISHCYKATSFIRPGTIVQVGEDVYFLEGEKLKVFNGVSVKDVPISAMKLLQGQDNRYAQAECFDGKYFLACRAKFDGQKNVGCEEGQFKNNALFIYDILDKHLDIVRGVDIRQLLALTNGLKSKLIACFYNAHKAKIGQLTKDGQVFENSLSCFWKSGKIDFEKPSQRKTIKDFQIISSKDCQIRFISDEGEKICQLSGGEKMQKKIVNLSGRSFEVEISSESEIGHISDFVLTVMM